MGDEAMVLPDVLAPGLHLVLCGTAPSRTAKERGAYYARPGNLFWPTLHAVGLTPHRLRPEQYPEVLRYGIGLTDLNKTEFGSDAELSPQAFDITGFKAKVARIRPAALGLDSKSAARAFFGRPALSYGRQPETLFGAAIFVLPSPSGRARKHWDIGPWREVGTFVRLRRLTARRSPEDAARAGSRPDSG